MAGAVTASVQRSPNSIQMQAKSETPSPTTTEAPSGLATRNCKSASDAKPYKENCPT
eukprot:CAMPEP_0119330124 /NCGR_PEP_ID=MMETSP1333-20130426/77570_1 /TAXON_ID=418940 /ORGANISM="Scyphosphaera apsteinii, Strain RCC1455" /LENGTH=56 /DNA_ID=CAMNT_0007339441 /DNA_START=79 /DNA_END=245 /DNA_ORIENTATION=+